jgi:hypothetical protein
MIRPLQALMLALGFAALGAPAFAAATPAPLPPQAPRPSGPLAYYIMAGTIIISAPFTDPNQCNKALAKMKYNNAQPGNDQIVCAHRRP